MNTKKEGNHEPVLERTITASGQRIRDTANQIGEAAARTSENLEESLDHIKLKFDTARNSVVDKAKRYTRATNGYVNKNPWAAVGISAGIAFLAGMLIGRKRED